MLMASSRLRLLYVCLVSAFLSTFVPGALYAQTPSPSLGVSFVPPYTSFSIADGVKTTRLAAGGMVVSYAGTGGPAAKAGIRPGDLIVSFNGKRVCQGNDLTDAVANTPVGTEVALVFVHGDEVRSASVKMASPIDFDPEWRVDDAVLRQIAADWERKDYKAVIADCRAIPEMKQAFVNTACALAHYNRRDWRKGGKLFEFAQAVCPQCPELFADQAFAFNSQQADYSATWAKAVQLMNDFSSLQNRAFAAMDSNVAAEIRSLAEQGQNKAALDRYLTFAQQEAGCRSVAPFPELADAVIQLKSKLDPALSVPESVARAAKQAGMAAQIAKSQPEMIKAEEKWIGVTWLAPWWGEGYTNAADLLDALSLPDDALALGRRALQLPRAKAPVTQQAPTVAEAPIGDPVEALRQCVNGLSTAERGSAEERRLRVRAINAALKMSPPPDVPMDARRLIARGQAAIEMAQSRSDFGDAAAEFEKGIQLAPWWAEAYKGLGMASEKAANYRQAMAAYDLYLKAAPNAPDVQDVESKIFKLEYAADREDKLAFEKVIAQKTANARLLGLQGLWREKDKTAHLWQATVQNGMLVANRPGAAELGVNHRGPYLIRAAIKGASLDGTLKAPPLEFSGTGCEVNESEQPLTGTISDDGRTITVKYQETVYTEQHVRATLLTNARCIKIEKLRDDTAVVVLEKQ